MPGSRNRDDFIAAAKSLFASRGFDGVTMRNIADALGLTQAALYYPEIRDHEPRGAGWLLRNPGRSRGIPLAEAWHHAPRRIA